MIKSLSYISCEFCKNSFISKKKNSRFCSGSCAGKHRTLVLKICNKKRIKILVDCHNCDKAIERCPSQVFSRKKGNVYCNSTCKGEAISKGIAGYGLYKKNKGFGNNPRDRKQVNGERFYVHRKLMEDFLGRKLDRKEHVHHINGDPKDNRLENLQVLNASDHGKVTYKENFTSF